MKVIHYRSLADEFGADTPKLGDNIPMVDFITNLPGDGCWYLAWRFVSSCMFVNTLLTFLQRAAWRFQEKHGRYPGEKTEDYKGDLAVHL